MSGNTNFKYSNNNNNHHHANGARRSPQGRRTNRDIHYDERQAAVESQEKDICKGFENLVKKEFELQQYEQRLWIWEAQLQHQHQEQLEQERYIVESATTLAGHAEERTAELNSREQAVQAREARMSQLERENASLRGDLKWVDSIEQALCRNVQQVPTRTPRSLPTPPERSPKQTLEELANDPPPKRMLPVPVGKADWRLNRTRW